MWFSVLNKLDFRIRIAVRGWKSLDADPGKKCGMGVRQYDVDAYTGYLRHVRFDILSSFSSYSEQKKGSFFRFFYM